jgi:hypothetical protein
MEIVTAEIGSSTPQRLLTTDDFEPRLSPPEQASSYFSYVTVNPANAYELFVALRSYGEQEHQMRIFSVRLTKLAGNLSVRDITSELGLNDSSVGFPSLLAPNGFVPFVVSSDGRWISASRPSSDAADTWLIFARDTELNETYQYITEYPSSTFFHPYYDWSKDGQWLIIVEENYLRLVAPGHNYERLIAHNLQSCSHVAWVDPIP